MRKFNYHNVNVHTYSNITEFWCSTNCFASKKLQHITFDEINFVEGRLEVNDLMEWYNPKKDYKVKL